MPSAPYATVRASIAGGAIQTGGITATGGQTCQLSADPAGLAGVTQYRWELLDCPAAFTVPAGWSADADGVFFSTAQTPPVFTLLSNANWGKYIIRLKLNGGGPTVTNRTTVAELTAIGALVDVSTAVSVPSIDGLHDLAYFEGSQFGGTKGWSKDHKSNLRLLQTLITGAGGGAGTSNHSALSNLLVDVHTQYLLASGARALSGNQSAGGFKITSLGTPTVSTDAATKAYVDSTSGFSPAGTQTEGYTIKSISGVPTWAPTTAYSITAFAAVTPVVRVGSTVVNPAFTATHSATPVTLLLTNTDNAESKNVVATPTTPSSSMSYTKTTNNATVTATLTGNDGISAANRSASIAWRPDVYWGTGVAGLTTEAHIEALASSELLASRVKTFSVNATGSLKVYLAIPASYGTPTFTVGGFSGGFTLVSATISVTNVNGVTQNYALYESDTPGLGSISVVVT